MAIQETISTSAGAAATSTLKVQISPVIEREFKRRDVFPTLRLETAERIQNGATGVHHVTTAVAQTLLADAKAMRAHSFDLPRGIPAAYGALVRNISASLKQEARRGLWDDPGIAEMTKRASQSPACFALGDTVLYFADDDEEYGAQVNIVQAYGLYVVSDDSGAYIAADGGRVSYQSGYVVGRKGSERTFFARARQLTRDDCKPAYLFLVASCQPAPGPN